MAVNLKGRSFLTLQDFTPAEIRYLLDLGHDLKAKRRAGICDPALKGKHIVLLFEKTSTRTRCSFEVAATQEGAHVTYLDAGSSQMGKKESLEDSAKVLGRFFDGIEYRGYAQKNVEELAKYAGVPVWNGLTDADHSAIKAGASLAEAAATNTAAGAQIGLNAALLACPITWVVIGVIALIAAVVGVIRYLDIFGAKSTSVFGTFIDRKSVV